VFVGCVRKHEVSKKGVIKELFSENRTFSREKGSSLTGSKDTGNLSENWKNPKIMVDD